VRRIGFSANEEAASEKLVGLIAADRRSRQTEELPIRCELFGVAKRLRRGESGPPFNAVLVLAGPEAYHEFITALFPELLTRVNNAESHGAMLLRLHAAPYSETFADEYLRYVASLPHERFNECDQAMLCFWIGLRQSGGQADPLWAALGQIREPVVDALAAHLAELRGPGWGQFE